MNNRKPIYIIVFLMAIHYSADSQSPFQAALDSGKKEFKKQQALYESDFNLSVQLLSEAVRLQPNHAEARYFLGYALDRLNMDDGAKMSATKLDLTLQASEQFEAVNKLQPAYKGEVIILDPYSKLSAIWGSLSFAYLGKDKKDSALWALSEGKKRGGFQQPILEYSRLILKDCKQDAVLISTGDNITFGLSYLQLMEGLRTDVTVIDAFLLGTGWYANYIKRTMPLIISHTERAIDSTEYLYWEPQVIKVANNDSTKAPFSWLVKPTYSGDYILRNDWMLMDILQHNSAARTFYFTTPSDTSYNLYLTDHLLNHGLVEELITEGDILEGYTTMLSKGFKNFSLDDIDASALSKSVDALRAINSIRIAYLTGCYSLLQQENYTEAKRLLQDMEAKFPLSRLPYADKSYEDYYEYVKSYVEAGEKFMETIMKD